MTRIGPDIDNSAVEQRAKSKPPVLPRVVIFANGKIASQGVANLIDREVKWEALRDKQLLTYAGWVRD